nr:MAG TPA: hypothetical protein [Caudoviricetes sp.]
MSQFLCSSSLYCLIIERNSDIALLCARKNVSCLSFAYLTIYGSSLVLVSLSHSFFTHIIFCDLRMAAYCNCI